ncbi:XRE family transcriptional regulator [Erysipelotrichia bacterium]|jgi:predicted XRE-type DNA-binding protein
MKNEIHESSGNVFLDLGYSSEDAEILRMRADLMAEVRKWISDQGLTQAEAAEILQVSQSRISDLVRGKWEKFSLEMLIVLAMRSGFNLTLTKVA